MSAKKIVHYQTDAKKASPEIEKFKAEKLEADRKLSEERKMLVVTQRKLRDLEYARRRGELIPLKIYHRANSWAFTVFKEHCRGGPSQLVRLVERTIREKYALDDADKHALRMAFTDLVVQQWLTELCDNLKKPPTKFLMEEAA